MRKIAIIGAVGMLGACSALDGVDPQVDYGVLAAETQSCSVAPSPTSTPSEMKVAGFTYIGGACEAFFVDATKAQRNALYGGKVLDAGLVGTTAAVGATASAAAAVKTIAITTAVIVLGKEIINQANSSYTFGTHLYKVKQLVNGTMDDYVARHQNDVPENYCKAHEIVAGLARLCSLAAMQNLLDQQVAIPSAAGAATITTSAGPSSKSSTMPRRTYSVLRPIASPTATGYVVQPIR